MTPATGAGSAAGALSSAALQPPGAACPGPDGQPRQLVSPMGHPTTRGRRSPCPARALIPVAVGVQGACPVNPDEGLVRLRGTAVAGDADAVAEAAGDLVAWLGADGFPPCDPGMVDQ